MIWQRAGRRRDQKARFGGAGLGNDPAQQIDPQRVAVGLVPDEHLADLRGGVGIHLLQVFLNANTYDSEKIMWLTIVHMAFVFSALLLAYIDRLMASGKKMKGGE